MSLIINASILDDKPTGLGIYTSNVITRLVGMLDCATKIYTTGLHALNPVNKAQVVKIPAIVGPKHGKIGGVFRFIWTQGIFPFGLSQRDIVYVTTHHGILWGKSKQIITIHDLLALKFPAQYRLQYVYFAVILPFLAKKAVVIITDSQSTKRDLHRYYKLPLNKIQVVYCGLDHSRFKIPENKDVVAVKQKYNLTGYFLMVGASYPHKNIGKAIQAFSNLKTSLPKLELVIVGGKKNYIHELQSEIRNSNIGRVRFIDYISPADLPAFYAGAIALVYPSLYEGFGLPPLEAMACGCPVIVSNTSSLPEVCGDSAFYINPASIEDIAGAMHTLAMDQNIRYKLREKGLKRASLFNWDQTVAQIHEIIGSVTGNYATENWD
jgi:glycosyltransferase involved in cell wall biosynthesis